jgi:Rps23 Pro-64 3,4-dihydroxylase Tpa1-like proline 4-hydroxylase
LEILSKKMRIQSIDSPYKIWIIDDFLDESVAEKINAEWPPNEDTHWFRGRQEIEGKKNILEHGMLAISTLENMPSYISEVVSYFHSDAFTELLKKYTGFTNLLSDTTMRWSGLRVMLPNSYQLIHSDARKNPFTGKNKKVTALYYLNKDYIAEDGGCLEIWNDSITECVHRIEPAYNRMVIFENSNTSYHGVPEVRKERRAITFSAVTEDSAEDRTKALFVKRPFDGKEVEEIGFKRAYIPD